MKQSTTGTEAKMDFLFAINVTFSFLNLLLNIFFSYCLVSSPEKIKQPLKILLELLISCFVLYLVSMFGKLILEHCGNSLVLNVALYLLSCSSLATSVTSTVWLYFYYYTQIVPAKRALTVWMKKNIKTIIYTALIFERIWVVADMAFDIVRCRALFASTVWTNTTVYLEATELDSLKGFYDFYVHFSWGLRMYFLLSVCVMIMSNVSISSYLIGHVRQMSANSLCFACPTVRGQLRVAVTGILQGVLYMCCTAWMTRNVMTHQLTYSFTDFYLHFSVVNVYMLGTSLNLCVGQAAFRQRVVDIIRALKASSRGDHSQAPTVSSGREAGSYTED